MTHTYALLPVSAAVHAEITARLRAAGYGGLINADGEIDMHGLALVVEPAPTSAPAASCPTGTLPAVERGAVGADPRES